MMHVRPPEFAWNANLEWWEGEIVLESRNPFKLYVFARSRFAADRQVTEAARGAIERLRSLEWAARHYASAQLLDIQQSVWADGRIITHSAFASRLTPGAVEVHESGYVEIHFGDGDLFRGHSVGVRIKPDGIFQEAVVEG